MKRETTALILLALAIMTGAASATISKPADYGNGKYLGIFFTEDDGTASPVTPSNKLPVDALVTIGSVSAEINLPRDAGNTPYFSLSQVASDALTLFNAWFAAANLDRLASTSEGLKVVATGVVRVSEIPAVTGTVDVGNFPAVQVASLPDGVVVTNFPATQTITGSVVASIPEAISATVTGTVTSVCTTTTPLEVSNPGVATSALYAADLATDTPTLLSAVVTLAANDIVEIQVSAASWRGPAGTASGTLQADGIKMSANDNPWSFRFSGVDYAFIADPAAVSRLRVLVHKDR